MTPSICGKIWARLVGSKLILGLLISAFCGLAAVGVIWFLFPPAIDELFEHGQNCLQKEYFDEAIADFTKVIESNKARARELRAKAFYFRGSAWDKKGVLPMALEDYDKAINLYKQIVKDRSSEIREYIDRSEGMGLLDKYLPDAFVKRGVIHSKVGKEYIIEGERDQAYSEYGKAVNDFNEALKLDAKLHEAYYNRGNIYLEEDLLKTAVADFSEAIVLNPNNAEALCQRARARTALGKHDLAIQDCQKAVELDSEHGAAESVMASAYAAVDDFDQSVSYFESAIRRDALLAKQITPIYADSLFKWGIALFEAGKTTEAYEAFAMARVLDEKYVILCQKYLSYAEKKIEENNKKEELKKKKEAEQEKAKIHYLLGREHLKNSAFDKALKAFTVTLRIDPKHARAYYGRGLAFLEDGFPDTAVEDFSAAISLNRNYAEAYCQRCRAYTELHDYYRAVRDGTQAVRLEPTYAHAYVNRSSAYLAEGSLDKAETDLRKAEAIQSGQVSPEILAKLRSDINMAYLNRGLACLANNNLNQAIADLEKVRGVHNDIKIDPWKVIPSLIEAHCTRGSEFLKSGRRKEANNDLVYADELLKKLAKSRKPLPTNLIDPDEPESLAKERILRLWLELARAYYKQGQDLQKDGFETQAREYFQRAKALGLKF